MIQFSPLLVFASAILPHGIFELTAVILATAAILKLGALLVTPQPDRSLGEVFLNALGDWFKVALRELKVSIALGALLAAVAFIRIVLWPGHEQLYTIHFLKVAMVVAMSLGSIVVVGAMVGAMLPFALRRLGLDPATASAPFVATLVDVTGLCIYFSVAMTLLKGTLL